MVLTCIQQLHMLENDNESYDCMNEACNSPKLCQTAHPVQLMLLNSTYQKISNFRDRDKQSSRKLQMKLWVCKDPTIEKQQILEVLLQ